ncbi:MAG: 2-oxoacid:acceptor oxidoreductase family protein [Lachnospiraceae bacterium]|nr:2-oxoacid:acceptor oxidoreductase family protein [Lachnospiraceae bacterium]
MNQIESNVSDFRKILDSGKDYYGIRLESIGGLGANLCGKMLGEMGIKYLDVNSSSFSSYGSEKTGTPVKGYIRYCRKDKEIRVHYPVVEPDLLVVFHQALLNDENIWKGCNESTSLIVALEHGQEKIVYKNKGIGLCYGIEAQRIAMETHSRINVVMLGATLKVMGIDNVEVGVQICTDTLGKKYPDALNGNLDGLRRGYAEVRRIILESTSDDKEKAVVNKVSESSHIAECNPIWGYDNGPIGGINPRIGSTVISDLSPSRQGYIPLFIKDRCINCGLCHSTCPDMVFQFKKGEYKGREMMVNQGLDYYHCKGCLRCVDVCPVNALVRGIESEHPEKKYFMVNQELLRMPKYYEKAGADGYITSESYLTEKRMEGGEV